MTWRVLKASPSELRLEFTLLTGQSFRWRRRKDETYIGVVRDRVFQLKQTANDVQYKRLNTLEKSESADDCLLSDYFNLEYCKLSDLTLQWAARDERFGHVVPFFPGARVLRQDPLECLFEFIASSNNHINRIQGMVESLCRLYGSQLLSERQLKELEISEEGVRNGKTTSHTLPTEFYAFPTLKQLEQLKEAELREHGFGYRAKYMEGHIAIPTPMHREWFPGCVRHLCEKQGGGEAWLHSLRSCSYEEAIETLCQLPGVGPKVAACVALFSLDKHQAIPVDTHVHQLVLKYYQPELEGKSLTKQVMKRIESHFGELFGESAGWAHNVLFLAELASYQHYLPSELRTQRKKRKRSAVKK